MTTFSLPMAATAHPDLRTSLRFTTWVSIIGIVLLIGVCGFWAYTTIISGAVIAQGQITVSGNPKQVQHLDGGIVANIAVQNGDVVTQGQVLIRLDPTLSQLNLDVAMHRLVDALTLKARLEAEHHGLAEPVFAYPYLPFALPDMTEKEIGQREIFAARNAMQRGGRDQLAETLLQYDNQITGLQAQIDAIREQIGYLDADIVRTRNLTDLALALKSELNDLQRAKADMTGRVAALEADIARLTNAHNESKLQTLQAERQFQEAVVTELREVTSQSEELVLEVINRQSQLDRVELRAPVAGIVHELQISTIGGVIAPGNILMQIIPQDQAREFEMRIDPRAVDQVYAGQTAQVIMAAFDPRSTPKLAGQVTRVSPNAITDPQTGQRFYRVDLTVAEAEIAKLGDVEIVPGMPVEAYLETGDRSVLAYLIQPLATQIRRAFRES